MPTITANANTMRSNVPMAVSTGSESDSRPATSRQRFNQFVSQHYDQGHRNQEEYPRRLSLS